MRNQQILLVEDDAAIMDTLTLFLRYEGYDVIKAKNVEQAIGTLEVTKPDLVLLDYMLQDDTAEPVVELLRQKYADEVVVILLTAADDPQGKACLVGADSVVSKPFELDVLLRCVKESMPGVVGEDDAEPKVVALEVDDLVRDALRDSSPSQFH